MSERSVKAVEESYKELAPISDRERSEMYRMSLIVEFIEKAAGGYSGKRVLDLGSSFGMHLIAAKKLDATDAVGLDKFIFPEAGANMYGLTQDEIMFLGDAWARNGIDIRRHDLSDPIPFPDGSFDLVVCNAVIEHVHGIHSHIFSEARRVLKPGGMFVFTTPNLASLLKRIRFIIGRSPLWDFRDYFNAGRDFTGHIREFTVQECRDMLTLSSFDVIRIMTRPSYFRWSWIRSPRKAQNILFQSLSRLWPTWGDCIFAVGRKSNS
jgi:SAM-dependent methyltransferase